MKRLLPLLPSAALALCACAPVHEKGLAQDVSRVYPGCTLEKMGSTRRAQPDSDQLMLVSFSYRCADEDWIKYGTFKYTKAVNTGFASYCCAAEARPEELL